MEVDGLAPSSEDHGFPLPTGGAIHFHVSSGESVRSVQHFRTSVRQTIDQHGLRIQIKP